MTVPAHVLPPRGSLRCDEPMARHTTWRVGGPADRFYTPSDAEDLAGFLRGLPVEEPVFWIGLGSNLLVRDGGIRGTVIATAGSPGALACAGHGAVRVEAGVPCARLARFCAREGLAGAEFLIGVPGTFGGALAMNAGCFGGETWALVEQVETIDRLGRLHRRHPEEYQVGYRRVRGPAGEWFLAATLRLNEGDPERLSAQMRQWLDKRSATQPTQQANAGSVFRNPPGDHAGRLIEACGLKGTCIGGACVSEKHANFIVNTGTATAADIEALTRLVAERVEAQHGISLELEVRVVGEPLQSNP